MDSPIKLVYFQCPVHPHCIRSGLLLDTGKIKVERDTWRILGKEYLHSQQMLTFDSYTDCYAHVASLGPKTQIGAGITSTCSFITTNIVRKQYVIPQPKMVLNEAKCLERLNKFSDRHFPLLINFSEKELWIDMSYCGEKATSANIPPDWKDQCDAIYNILSFAKIFHRDISYHNVLIRDNTVNLIDFGNATLDTDEIDRTRSLYVLLHNENGRSNSHRRHRRSLSD